jgi:RNA polymerase sigma-70 factor (ECF subfamily)
MISPSYREFQHEDFDQISLPAQNSPESGLELRRISGALAKLEKKYRDVVVLCVIESYSYAEAAEILDIPSGTVASRLHAALHSLRSQLRER